MTRFLELRLEGPLMSFGGATVNEQGPTERLPGLSMITGLLANALGYDFTEADKHQDLQDRLTFIAGALKEGKEVHDMQQAAISSTDRAWTTRGAPMKRGGNRATTGPVLRRRDYWADAAVIVVLELQPSEHPAAPSLEDFVDALERPARPVFLGRKNCSPSRPLFERIIEAESLEDAFLGAIGEASVLAEWPAALALPARAMKVRSRADRFDWKARMHKGTRLVAEGRVKGVAEDRAR